MIDIEKLKSKHESVLLKAAAVIRARGHEGDARLADSVIGIIAHLKQHVWSRRSDGAAGTVEKDAARLEAEK